MSRFAGRGARPEDEELATATVLIEQKRFHIGLKANANGKFLKITEITPSGFNQSKKSKVRGSANAMGFHARRGHLENSPRGAPAVRRSSNDQATRT